MSEQNISLAEAQQRAADQAWTVQRILSELEHLDLSDSHFIAHCKTLRDELVPLLIQAIHERDSIARLKASVLLLHLGEPLGTDGIITCIRDDNEEFKLKTLVYVSLLPLRPITENSSIWQRPPVQINRDMIFAEIRQFIDQPDSRTGKLALEIAMKLELPETGPLVRPLINHPSPQVKVVVLRWLAEHGEDNGALDTADALLFGPQQYARQSYWIFSALESYCEGNQPELARKAAVLLIRYVQAYGQRPDNETANLISRAIKVVAQVQPPDEKQMLEEILQSSANDWRKGVALKRLGKIEGESGIERLCTALSDSLLREDAAETLADVAKGQSNPHIIEALVNAARDEKRQDVLGAIVDALIAIGPNIAQSAISDLAAQLNPHDAMKVHWLVHKLTPQSAVERLIQAGAIVQPPEDVLLDIEANWQKESNPTQVILSSLDASNRLTGFDCEAGIVPVDYVDLIDTFLRISRERFDVESVSQQVNTNTGESRIAFVYNQKAYEFIGRNFGDWYDVGAVIHALNSVLEESQKEERFILIYTGDQTCLLTFVPDIAFREAVRDLALPLEDDFQSAMNRGVAYEQHVLNTLKGNK